MPVEHVFIFSVTSLMGVDFHETFLSYSITQIILFYLEFQYLFKRHLSTLHVLDAPLNKCCIDFCIHVCDWREWTEFFEVPSMPHICANLPIVCRARPWTTQLLHMILALLCYYHF